MMKVIDAPLFRRIVDRTPFSNVELSVLIQTAPKRYKEHLIAKRRGGTRLISQPTKELKLVQRIVIQHELNNMHINDAAFAYRPGKSIHDHAMMHAKNHFLLKLDFKDFFHSLTPLALDRLLPADKNYGEVDKFILHQLLFRQMRGQDELRLSIGAPSSPFLSNCLLREFDERLQRYCASNSITYSRYADDLALSTAKPWTLDKAKRRVERILKVLGYLQLHLNEDKTVNVSTKNRRTLTGLVLSNDGNASVGRDAKRAIRAAVHALLQGKLATQERNRLGGQLAFLYSVDRPFIESLATHYGLNSGKALLQQASYVKP